MARETTNLGRLGGLQTFRNALNNNSGDLPHLEGSRAMYEVLVTKASDLANRQSALTAQKQDASKQLTVVLEANQLAERDVPDFLEVDHGKQTAKFTRIPTLTDVPFAVQMEPHLVVEFYSR